MYQKICKKCGKEFQTNRKNRDYCSKPCSNQVIAINRENAKLEYKIHSMWACGGGVQSSAIAALICKGDLPKPDYSLMVDVGYEKQSTWEHVNNVLIPNLTKVGINLIVLKTTDYTNNDIFDNGCLLIPAYGIKDGKTVKFRTLCSDSWKGSIMRKYLREQGVQRCENWTGISYNETKRMRTSPFKWITNRYPLIERQMNKDDCLYLTAQMGWPMAPRTSCWMCPGQSNAEWYQMKKFWPCDWQLAVKLEANMRIIKPDTFLHSQCVLLNNADLKQYDPNTPCVHNVNDCICL